MIFDKYKKEIKFGLSKKQDGAMNVRDDSILKENRKKFFLSKKIDSKNLVIASLVHGNNVLVISDKQRGQVIKNTDGLVTNKNGIALAVTVADCVPIFFYDHKQRVVGVIHAGWKGIVKNITASAVETIINNFKSDPEDILVYIGPRIKECHFEVKEDVAMRFEKYPSVIYRQDRKILIDLGAVIKTQLIDKNLKSENIELSKECTYCKKDKYFSYRRDKSEMVKSQIAYIKLI